ncbi:MAG: X-Pro aminopeptidase [Bacteroidetes bacterium GWF2_33_16]|nr:MAG: X-Pro aminopeptidase [Bacteroidetes bacterium GWE2_32_14]OFY07666.1 MAG: X-Pro aminopeptidase [Bacteroidetes bacterium GWF2_33_16]
MKYDKLKSSLFERNRKKLIKDIQSNSLAVIHSNDQMPRNGDQYFPFRQNSDLFYLCGIDQEKTILTLCPNHPNKDLREILFIIESNEKIAVWEGHKYTKAEATETSGITNIKYLSEFDTVFRELAIYAENIYLNLNENPKFKTDILSVDERFLNRLKSEFPAHKLERLAPIMKKLRLKKENEEIELMQKACDITNKSFHRVLRFVKPGVTEYEVEAELTHEFLWNKASGHAYAPIIASGKSACILHYVENNKTCNDGDLLLIDFGAEYANYAADCTRTIPVNGKFTPRQRECYEAVLRVMKKAVAIMIPGTTINNINDQVDLILQEEHINLGLYTKEDVAKQDKNKPFVKMYYPHGTSHFIGLDVHDVGDRTIVLEEGMVLTCEPGIYIPEENIGIRIENDIVIGLKPIDLMQHIPREVDEIEMLMENNN